jgi:putative ABC transport system substrate-binding protein
VGLVVKNGSNIFSFTSGAMLGSKRLELLHELVPTATSIALLVNQTNPDLAEALSRDVLAAGGRLGLRIHILHAGTDRDLGTAFATLAQLRVGGLVIGADPFLTGRMELLAALALRHAVPAIFQYRDYAAAGSLVSYGGSVTDSSHQAGIYAGRILRGEKPAELPVVQTTKVELIINLKTAKALSLTVPMSLLGRADEVIE